jgi:hypothetical protein
MPKDLRRFYTAMGGLPVIRIPAPSTKDQSFALYGRQVPRVLSYKWGDR